MTERNYNIFQDWVINKGNPKGRFVLVNYRLAILIRYNRILLVFFFWYLLIYIFFVEWLLGIELTLKANVGSNTQIWHGHSLVLNPSVVIGNCCVLRHNTTIGNNGSTAACPIIGENVNIGANVCIIGDVRIGSNVIIGAGSVVIKDVPSNCVAVGNPAKVVKYI